jgi:hypothetical protein
MARHKPHHGISIGNEREEGKCFRLGKISAHDVQMDSPIQ